MSNTTIQDRAAGAIMGACIGDAMGLGPHWYYDLAELLRDYASRLLLSIVFLVWYS